MLASTGNINQPYDVVGVVHASVAKTVSKNGCGVASGLPTQQTYEEATQALKGGFAVSDVARIVPLDRATEGIAAYADAMSAGKTLIRLSDDDLGVAPAT